MKLLLLTALLFTGLVTIAQHSDFILLKHKGKTITTYFEGSYIGFTSINGAFIEANILKIKSDTLFLREYVVRQLPTQLGVYVVDTVAIYYNQYHYNQVKSIGKTGRRFDVKGSGAALMGGGALLLIASGVVYLADNKNFSPRLMIAAGALGGLGYLLTKTGNDAIKIGKKYSLVYIQAVAAKKT